MRNQTNHSKNPRRAAFTLMELIVAVSILVIIILSVAVIFRNASGAVTQSQATMDMVSSIRAVEQMVERDLQHIDKNGFLVIRSRLNNPSTAYISPSYSVANPGPRYCDLSPHFDQICFIENGTFANPTGCDSTTSPFTDSSTGNAAVVWIGQGVVESAAPPDVSYLNSQNAPYPLATASGTVTLPAGGQGAALPTGLTTETAAGWTSILPTGAIPISPVPTPPLPLNTLKESEFTLMRHATVLMSGPIGAGPSISPTGNKVLAYNDVDLSAAANVTGNEGPAHITSSRYAVSTITPAQIMQNIAAYHSTDPVTNYLPPTYSSPFQIYNRFPTPKTSPEASFFTYRFRALASVYDTDLDTTKYTTASPFVNGYYRTHPVLMNGISSFKVEWTDGAIYGDPSVPETSQNGVPTKDPNNFTTYSGVSYPNGIYTGQVKWYGASLPSGTTKTYGPPLPPTQQPFTDNQGLGRKFGTDNTAADPDVEYWNSTLTADTNGDHYVAVFSYFNHTKWPKALRITYHVYNDRLGSRDFVQIINLPQ